MPRSTTNIKLFSQYVTERKVDPVRLAQRVSRRYGVGTSFGKWDKVPRGGHIPLTSYSEKVSSEGAEALDNFQLGLGMDDPDPTVRNRADRRYDRSHSNVSIDIARLVATQPYVMTQDVEKLRAKLTNDSPSHIHVIKHNNRYLIDDGHHAVVAAQLRGEKRVNVRLLDLD